MLIKFGRGIFFFFLSIVRRMDLFRDEQVGSWVMEIWIPDIETDGLISCHRPGMWFQRKEKGKERL